MQVEHDELLLPPMELVLRGSVGMTESIILGVAYDMRIPLQGDETMPQTDHLRQFGIAPLAQRAGYVRLQSLPGDRTLVTLWPDEPGNDTDIAVFSAFTSALAKQLARLDFYDLPGVEKTALGFRHAERPSRSRPASK